MKKFIVSILLMLPLANLLYAQNVGINNPTPAASALLDLTATDKGLLIPRLTTTQRNAISSPATGLMVYDITLVQFYYYDGSIWRPLSDNKTAWNTTGNAGTNPSTNFIGTTDNSDIVFKRNNIQAGLIGQGNSFFGLNSGANIASGTMNTCVGYNSGYGNITSSRNTYIGNQASGSDSISHSTALGDSAYVTKSNSVILGNNADVGIGRSYPDSRLHVTGQVTIGNGSVATGSTQGLPFSYNQANTSALFFGRSDNQPTQSDYAVMYAEQNNNGSNEVTRLNIITGDNAGGGSTPAIENDEVFVGSFDWQLQQKKGILLKNGMMGVEGNMAPEFPISFSTNNGDKISFSGSTANTAHYGIGLQTNLLQLNTNSSSGDIAFGYGCSNSFVENVRIKGNGNVGIGTTNPSYKLHIGTYNNGLRVEGPSTSGGVAASFGGYGDFQIDGYGLAGGRFVVKDNGNVGIGVNNPIYKLAVMGDANLRGITSIANSTSSSYYGRMMHTGGGGNFHLDTYGAGGMALNYFSGTNVSIGNGASGIVATFFATPNTAGNTFELNYGNAAKPGGGSWAATSDARLKQQIQNYDDGLASVLKINPVTYHYNQLSGYDSKPQYVGVLAQQLKEVAPYMVGTFTKDGTEYYNVDNSALTYMLVNAVKELSAKNDTAMQQIIELKKAVDELVKARPEASAK
ncbi:MAG: tail fiber domain-containing protein [Bacteroidia bacterium]